MSRVVFMCGPAGSGKSTIARRLEKAGMARLSVDEEAWRRGARTMPLSAELSAEIADALRTRLIELVAADVDVVLDFSFWSRSSRDAHRQLVRSLGVEPETIYLATSRETVLARLRSRRTAHANDFALSEETAARYFDQFEVPTADEGPLTVVR